MIILARLIVALADVYAWIIFAYCLLTWFPISQGIIADIRNVLARFVEPFLGLFRKIIPPIGGMVDISPIVAFFVLQFAVRIIVSILV